MDKHQERLDDWIEDAKDPESGKVKMRKLLPGALTGIYSWFRQKPDVPPSTPEETLANLVEGRYEDVEGDLSVTLTWRDQTAIYDRDTKVVQITTWRTTKNQVFLHHPSQEEEVEFKFFFKAYGIFLIPVEKIPGVGVLFGSCNWRDDD